MSDKIADKIRKLIAHADSTTNQTEAETFMAKVHALLTAHGLSMFEVGKLGEDPVGVTKRSVRTSRAYSFMNNVAPALGKYYGLRIVSVKIGKDVLWSMAGRESARTTFTLMLPYVQRRIQDLGLEAFRGGQYKTRMQAVNYIGNALAIRIYGMVKANEQAAKESGQATTGVNALVPVDLIEQALQEAFPELRKARTAKVKIDQYAVNAAAKVNLDNQIDRQNRKQIGSK